MSPSAPYKDNVDINMIKNCKKELLKIFRPEKDFILADKGYVSDEVKSWGFIFALPKLQKGQQDYNERDQVDLKHLNDVRSKICSHKTLFKPTSF